MSAIPLTYPDAGAAARRPVPPWYRSGWLRTAVACWAVPLVVGLGIFAASEGVRAVHHGRGPFIASHGGPPPVSTAFGLLADLGLLDVMAGGIATMLGGVAVVAFVGVRWSAASNRFPQVVAPAVGITVLLASNLVVALAVMGAASR